MEQISMIFFKGYLLFVMVIFAAVIFSVAIFAAFLMKYFLAHQLCGEKRVELVEPQADVIGNTLHWNVWLDFFNLIFMAIVFFTKIIVGMIRIPHFMTTMLMKNCEKLVWPGIGETSWWWHSPWLVSMYDIDSSKIQNHRIVNCYNGCKKLCNIGYYFMHLLSTTAV